MRLIIIIVISFILCTLVWVQCNTTSTSSLYQNTNPQKAHYVGMQTCKKCHQDIYNSYIKTGMGKSWNVATTQFSTVNFPINNTIVYDSALDFYYRPFYSNEEFYIQEYRLLGKDTIYSRVEKMNYQVGSGLHTTSFIQNINGYLHQAPIAYYTQKNKWDLAPGFEHGENKRFEREMENECITCHNAYPQFNDSSYSKYTQIKTGIDCERCHGPGSLHVDGVTKKEYVDVAKDIDYRIVNPRKLPVALQNSICQRCHLQGITVLNDQKTFYDFYPSQELKNTMQVFAPRFNNKNPKMIMASHAERMSMSKCFINSGEMGCITCHNPHVSVLETPVKTFNTSCIKCHNANQQQCTETKEAQQKAQENCVQCHMPTSTTIDIPHITITDHYIRRKPQVENVDEIKQFIELKCYNNSQTTKGAKAIAYMDYFERLPKPDTKWLDSTFYYLNNTNKENMHEEWIRYYFLKNDFSGVVHYVEKNKLNEPLTAWSYYRLAESYQKIKMLPQALKYYQLAIKQKPYALSFQYKYAIALVENKQELQAQKIFEFILSQNPSYALAATNLGYLFLQQGKIDSAKKYLLHAITLNPDNVQTLINLSVFYHTIHQHKPIQPLLLHAQKLQPHNAQIQAMLEDLKGE